MGGPPGVFCRGDQLISRVPTGRVVAQFFEYTDRKGTRWWGLLSVAAPPGDARLVEFRIGVRRNGA